jgi:hypothetical protein
MNITGEKISSGFLSDYEPLGVNGDPVYRAATQIKTLLIKDLGENVANLFATPIRDDRNNSIDWYSAEKGQLRPFHSLSQTEQENYSRDIKEKLASVEELGLRLAKNTQNQTAITYSGLLKSIQNYPDSSQIFIVNERPIIAFWGFNTRQALDIPTASKIAPPVQPPSINNPELQMSPSSLDRALTSDSKINSPPTNEESTVNTQIPFNENFISRTSSFWSRYGWWLLILLLIFLGAPTFMRGCSTDFPLLNDPRLTSVEPVNQIPNLSEPSQTSAEPSIPVADSSEPIFTKKALSDKDLSIFKGNWILVTELLNSDTKEVIKLKMTFDESGQGNATVQEKNGQTCSGSANAKIDSENSFSISTTGLACEDKRAYVPTSAVCKVLPNLTTAECVLTCADVSAKCSAVFERHLIN